MANNKIVNMSIFFGLVLMFFSTFSFSQSDEKLIANSISEINTVTSSASQIQLSEAVKGTTHKLPNYGKKIAETLLYLGLIVGLIFFLAWMVKKAGHNRLSQTQLMKVTACLPLSTKEKLMVVQIGDEQVVIGVAPGFVGHIMSLKQPLVVEASNATDESSAEEKKTEVHGIKKTIGSASFATLLSRLQQGKEYNDK